ncbi:hypothetical protein MNBD_NITROSPINAE02-1451 [hydrothermal vent metagenome]|uniref:Lipopolysaccharide export system permease protein LptF n=1 Tax=hydrothermal vent metagenome TaxID=652676 RepID=A0A3B1CAB5_9ZZZZ
MRVLDRYIVSEQLKVFFLAIFLLITTLVLERVNFLTGILLSRQASAATIGQMLFYLSPSFLTISAPLAILMSSLMIFSRFSAENEITVMRASGISLFRLLVPAALVSFLACMGALYLSLNLEHVGNLKFQMIVMKTLKSGLSMEIKAQRFNSNFENMVIRVDKNKNGALSGVFISDQRNEDKPKVIEAARGRLIGGQEGVSSAIELFDGVIHTIGKGGVYQTIAFQSYTLRIGNSSDDEEKFEKGVNQLSISELRKRIATLQSQGEPANYERVTLHKKFAMPVGCIALGLLGVPLGMMTQRRGSGGGFGLGVLVIAINYLLWMIGQEVGTGGKVPPFIAVWTPNVVMSSIGLFLILRVSKDSMPTKIGLWLFRKKTKPKTEL